MKVHHTRWIASVGSFAVLALLAACGQTSTSTGHGTGTGSQALQTPSATSAGVVVSPSPTDVPPPYAFPKHWTPAPDGADLPQWPEMVGSYAFSQSSPRTGYFCVASPDAAYDSPTVPPAVSVTRDGGHSWGETSVSASGSASRFKSVCQIFLDQSNAQDIFVAAGKFSSTVPGPLPLFRSQDGGATWKNISQPTLTGNTTYIAGLAVVQSRILIMIAPEAQAGPTVYSLFSSDDGGQTWKPITMTANGQQLQFGAQMWVSGTTVYVEAGTGCTGACGGLRAPVSHKADSQQFGAMPRTGPHSSGAPPVSLYFKSSDGGRNWTQLATPVNNLRNFTVQRSTDSSTTYVLGTAFGVPNQPPNLTFAYYSRDGGVTWRQLPTLQGVENGYLDPGSLGTFGSYILPNGSVITTADHLNGTQYGGDAGAFLLNPGDASPSWKPLIRSLNGVTVQVITTSAGARIWGLQMVPQQAGGFLVYFDLP